MKSRKSASEYQPHHHRLDRTLKRKPSYHEFTFDDIKYFWAAHKMGMFPEIDLEPQEFQRRIAENLSIWDAVYILETDKPVGFILGRFMGPVMMLVEMNWFPWATTRNKYETTTHLLNELRKKFIVMGFSDTDHKKFWVHLCKHGIVRRVGTVNGIYDEPAAMYQTRSA